MVRSTAATRAPWHTTVPPRSIAADKRGRSARARACEPSPAMRRGRSRYASGATGRTTRSRWSTPAHASNCRLRTSSSYVAAWMREPSSRSRRAGRQSRPLVEIRRTRIERLACLGEMRLSRGEVRPGAGAVSGRRASSRALQRHRTARRASRRPAGPQGYPAEPRRPVRAPPGSGPTGSPESRAQSLEPRALTSPPATAAPA